MDRIDESLKPEIAKWAANYDHRLKLGNKPIYHLEAFVAKVMFVQVNFTLSFDIGLTRTSSDHLVHACRRVSWKDSWSERPAVGEYSDVVSISGLKSPSYLQARGCIFRASPPKQLLRSKLLLRFFARFADSPR